LGIHIGQQDLDRRVSYPCWTTDPAGAVGGDDAGLPVRAAARVLRFRDEHGESLQTQCKLETR